MERQKTIAKSSKSNNETTKKGSSHSNDKQLKGKKGSGNSSQSKQMPDVFKDQNEKHGSTLSNVKLDNSQSSFRSSAQSISLGASSLMSGKSMLMSKRSSSKRANQKYIIKFGSDENIHSNQKNINRIRLTRYTALSFGPLSLLYQFKRAANVYFLIITILTFLPFTPKNPSSMIGTFAFVLVMTMLKEAYEDFQRYKTQKDLNGKKAKVYSYETNKFEQMKWEKIKAGMLIRLEKDNEIPADIILIHSSNISGLIFVDTMALDGETNLKEKMSICESFDEKGIGNLQGEMTVDAPNELLEYWEGFIQSSQIQQKTPCSIKNLILRGSIMRNTKYAYGIVVYTGMQTKILKNLKKPPHKVSNVMKKMNQMLYTVFVFQVFLVLLFAGLNYQWAQDNFESHDETGKDGSQATFVDTFLVQAFVFWVAYSHLIPISLYVIIEMLKLGQSYLINKDIQMYDRESKTFAECRNSDLIEELGQVEMIFSDKTGTLTMNKMIFKKCQIQGDRIGDANQNVEKNEETTPDECDDGMNHSGREYVKKKLKEECRKYYKNIKSDNNSIYQYPFMNFVKVLALCHSVVCDIDVETKEIRYQASSPDELALVQGARDFGIKLVSRNHNKLEIENQLNDVREIYKVVAEFPFDSTRKCMSVIVRDQFMRYYLLTKGADSVMFDKINFEKSKNPKLKETIIEDLSQYSKEGLRTLVMAMRQVPENEFSQFQKLYNKLVNSNSPYKDKKITELYVKMENKLRYLGCTAIEDKLQEGVPQTIAMLIKADIRFWMLTGDKLETAIEIAKSCRIILDGNQLLILSTNDFEILMRTLDNQIEILGLDTRKKVKSLKNYDQQNLVIAVDGSTLSLILEDPELEEKFFYVSLVAKSVICCRVSPKQKADVVSLYKKRGDWVTLGVGDGANDVSMILEANIGIGIKGKEGTQAVRSADYAIAQFRYIQKLIMVHGHWGYRRVAKMICYYFYKNIILVFTELYFAFYNGFSGQIYFPDWLPMLYNAVFTSWPCLLAFNFEQDVNAHYIYKYPIVYQSGQQGRYFNFKIFWKQIIFAQWHGLVCFYGPMMTQQLQPDNKNGQTYEHWYHATITFTIIIHLVSYKLFVESNFWNIFSFISAVTCVIFYYIVCLALSSDALASFLQQSMNGVMIQILLSPKFFFMVIALPFTCLIPDSLMKHGHAIFCPYPGEKIMIEQKKNPHFSFSETLLKSNMHQYLANVIKKNKSYGMLTSKALSEIDKQSLVSGVLSANSSAKRFGGGSPSRFNNNNNTQNAYFQDSSNNQDSPVAAKKRRQSRIAHAEKILSQIAKGQELQQQNGKEKQGTSQAYQNRNKLKKFDHENDSDQQKGPQDQIIKLQGFSEHMQQDDHKNNSYIEQEDQHAQVISIKIKGKQMQKQNTRLDKMKEKEQQERDKKAKKNKQNKGNETTHQLLNESVNIQSDNDMNNSVSSLLLKQRLQNDLLQRQEEKELQAKQKQRQELKAKEKQRRLLEEQIKQQQLEQEQNQSESEYDDEEEYDEETQEDYSEEEEEDSNQSQNNDGTQRKSKFQQDQMRQQSYKERKKRLMQNIKQEQMEKRKSEMKQLQASYHSTQSNNKMVMGKLDEFSKIAETHKQSKNTKNNKRAVRDHLYAQPQNNNVVMFNSQNSGQQIYTSDVPYMINYQASQQLSDTTTNIGSNYYQGYTSNFSYHLPPEKLKIEGHPLEKAQSGIKSSIFNKKYKKPKRYVEKYRELIKHSSTAKDSLDNQNTNYDRDVTKVSKFEDNINNQNINTPKQNDIFEQYGKNSSDKKS